MERNIPEVGDVIKYVAEVVEMPRWSTMNYKPSCSKWWDPSDRIYGNYAIYDPYIGKADGKRRGGQSVDTVGGRVEGVEGGEGVRMEEPERGGLRRLPDSKGEPGQESVKGGGYSNQVSGKVKKFVSMYEAKMQIKNRKISARKKLENIQSYFSVCGPMKTKFDISSPVKRLDMGKYGEFFSPASKRKYRLNMEHGHQCAGGIFSVGKDSELDYMREVMETKKPRRSVGH